MFHIKLKAEFKAEYKRTSWSQDLRSLTTDLLFAFVIDTDECVMNASTFPSGKILPVCLHNNFPLFVPANETKHRQLTDDIKRKTENYQSWYWLEKEYPSQVTDTTSIRYTKPEAGFASNLGQPKTWTDSRFSTTHKHNQEPFIFCSHHYQVWLDKPTRSLKLHQLPCWLLPKKCQVPSVRPEISASAKWTVGDRIRA